MQNNMFDQNSIINYRSNRNWQINFDSNQNNVNRKFYNQSNLVLLLNKTHEPVRVLISVGTGSELFTEKLINLRLHLERSICEEPKIASTKSQIDYIRTTMGLNMSEIASILNVSRQSVYDWISDNDSKLRHDHQERLDILSDIGAYWGQKGLGRLGSYLCKKINNENLSLLKLLQKSKIDKKHVHKILDQIADVIRAKKVSQLKHEKEVISEEEMNKNLDRITRIIG